MPRKAIIGGNEYYFQQDVLRNVTAITDANGDIMETYEYDVFGKPTVRDALGAVLAKPMTPFLMTGHYYDADVGIYITRYRAYSPDLGRWLTRDPIDFNGGDWNLYGYVLNNPINYWDPEGGTKYSALGRVWETDIKGDQGHYHSGAGTTTHHHSSDGAKLFPEVGKIQEPGKPMRDLSNRERKALKNVYRNNPKLGRAGGLALLGLVLGELSGSNDALCDEIVSDLRGYMNSRPGSDMQLSYAASIGANIGNLTGNAILGSYIAASLVQ